MTSSLDSTARPCPPPLAKLDTDGYYRCPLCKQRVRHFQAAGTAAATLMCGHCAAFWMESDVVHDRPGRWDDCGVQCSAFVVPNVIIDGRQRALFCILGEGHGEHEGGGALHVSQDGWQWHDDHALDPTATTRPDREK
jgi:hypothetical protein